MFTWLRLSHYHHSGRLQPHEHTSYAPLGLLLFVVGVALVGYTASASPTSPGPQAGSVGLAGVVPGKPPTLGATITSPHDGQHFTTSPVTFSGTCPANTLVELFKNDIFAGSTPCTTAGTFSLDVDLLIGKNVVIARVYDALNQPGPDSKAVTVFYDVLPSQAGPLSALDFGGTQLLLNTDAVFRGVFPDHELTIPLDIIGGRPPYAVNIQWGDSSNKIVPRNDNITFNVGHIYKKPGTYQISMQATDADGRVAFLTVASIVNGQPDIVPVAATTGGVNNLLLLWPLYVGAIAVVISFWLGERREKRLLRSQGLILSS